LTANQDTNFGWIPVTYGGFVSCRQGVADGPKIISPLAAAIETKQSETECFVLGLGKMLEAKG